MQKIDYKSYEKPSDYFKFTQGDNVLRIISGGGLMRKHGMQTARGWVPLGECKGVACEHCLKGNMPKDAWMWIAYDRAKHNVRLLEVGPTVGNGICELGRQYGDPQEYDIIVNRVGEGKNTKYKVSKSPKSQDIPESELPTLENNKQYLINKHFKPNGTSKSTV